jgi:hypothetical protein
MKKDKLLESGVTMVESIKDGELSILIKLKRPPLKVLTRNSDGTLTDHSTLSHNFHSTESLRCSVVPTSSSRDGERMLDNNNSSSMRFLRLSETTTGRTIALIFKETEDPAI